MSTLGRISVTETLWREGRGQTWRPFCASSQVRVRGCSRPLRRALVDFGADQAFGAAAEKVREHYALEVPVSRIRRECLRLARALPTAPEPGPRTLAARGPAAIIAEVDGTMIPVVDMPEPTAGLDRRKHRRVRYQEMRLMGAQAQGQASIRYAASFGDPALIGARWCQLVRRAGWAAESFIHGVGDGAEWIAEQFRQHFAAHGRYTLDLFHVCDYLAAAAPDPAQPGEFVRACAAALRENRSAEIIAALAARCESPELSEANAPVRRAHRYLSHRSEQLDYQGALARNLPVGSGLIEGGHRHVLQARLKLSGAWWLPDNANAMAQLRVCRANGGWDDLWKN